MGIRHTFTCTIPDIEGGHVKPSNWNAEHAIDYETVETNHLVQAARGFDAAARAAIELEDQYAAAYASCSTTYGYTGDVLDTITVWTDGTKTVALFTVALTYDGGTGLLTSRVVTRVSDGATLTKTYSYDGSSRLTDIDRAVA